MNILEQIKLDLVSARRAHAADKAINLGTLRSEIEKRGTYKDGQITSRDDDTIRVIKSFIENCSMCLGADPADNEIIFKEIALYESYLPKQLSETDMRAHIGSMSSENLNLPAIMKYFKTNFPGQYDGKKLSEVVRTHVNQ